MSFIGELHKRGGLELVWEFIRDFRGRVLSSSREVSPGYVVEWRDVKLVRAAQGSRAVASAVLWLRVV